MKTKTKIALEIAGTKTKFDQISISQDVHDHHHFTIECDAMDLDQKDRVIGADDTYALIGSPVSIIVKGGSDSKSELKFIGFIEQVELTKGHRTFDRIILTGRSETKLLDSSRNACTFTEKTVKEIAEVALASLSSKLKINIPSDESIDYVTQYKESGFDFISRLAALKGLWFYSDGEDIHLGSYEETNSLKLKLGPDLGTYNLNLHLRPLSFSDSHYDYADDEFFSVDMGSLPSPKLDRFGNRVLEKSKEVFTVLEFTPTYEKLDTEAELKKFTETRLNSISAQMCRLYGSSTNPAIQIGTRIELLDRNNESIGHYYVVQVSHELSKGPHYGNQFEAIPANLESPPPNPYVSLPKAHTQVAIVKENEDPDGLGRIKVQFPWQDKNETTPWLRRLTPYGGAGDFYFQPEIGDQVMVGFEFNHPDRPFIIGSIYHGQNKPQDHTEKNEIKSIRTKAGHLIQFNDGDPGEILITTKDEKCKVSLSNDSDGIITILSGGEINFETKKFTIKSEEFSLETEKRIMIKSGSDTEVAGANITVKADQAATLKGADAIVEGQSSAAMSGAQVKIDGSATTAVTGGLITLN